MIPTGFLQENGVLDKPKDMSYDQCEALSVWRGNLLNGFPAIISCWKPTKDELDELNRTGRLWLIVLGEKSPPITPTGYNPFEEHKR